MSDDDKARIAELQPLFAMSSPSDLMGMLLGKVAQAWRTGTPEEQTAVYYNTGMIISAMTSLRKRMEEEGHPKLPIPPGPPRNVEDMLLNNPIFYTKN